MKCDNCPACYFHNYEEGEPDFGCNIGIADNDRVEFKDLSLGCRIPYNKVVSLLRGKAKIRYFSPFESEDK